MQNSNEENLTGLDEAVPKAAATAPRRTGLVTAIVDTVAGAAAVVLGFMSIASLVSASSSRRRFDWLHSTGDFEAKLAYIFALPILLAIMLCGWMLLFGGISALKRSGRGFVWSATACALLALSAGVYFARYFSLLRDPMEYKWYLLIVIFVLLAAAALGVLNVAAYRKSAPGQTKRLGQIALAVPILLLLFLLFGWYRVGTFLMLRNLTEKGGDYVEIYNGKVSSDVIEYKEDWGETELEHHKVGGYIVTVPKGYFGTVESSSSEPDWDGYLHTPRLHTVSMCNDDLTVALFDVPDENEPGEFSILGIFLTPDFPVDLFDGTADPFECHKMVLNTVPADFSLFSTHNDCLKLLVRLETKPLIGTTGSGCFRQEIKTEHLRGLHGRMIKPFVAELFDSQGRQMTLYVWSAEEELTPEHQRIIKNFIASIRPVKN